MSLAAVAAACDGCKGPQTGPSNGPDAQVKNDLGEPTIRLVVATDIAGALEPCGCVKDQLGGLDHAGAWIRREMQKSKNIALVAAGPVFFMEPELAPERKAQDMARAETIAKSLASLNFVAFAASKNDVSVGREEIVELVKASGASMLLANLPETGFTVSEIVREINGVKVGFVGVADTKSWSTENETSREVIKLADAVRGGVARLKSEGARVFVLLASTGRGEAKRLAEAVPELTAVVVGSAESKGEGNTQAAPVERVGKVLIVEAANHLQTVSVINLYVRGNDDTFADALGLDRIQRREEITRRVDELRVKVAVWEKDPKIQKSDIEARRADITKLEAERAELLKAPTPATGSYFTYAGQEVRENLGVDEGVKNQMLAYYKRVNERNKEIFKDKKPQPPEKGEPKYMGIETCSSCHEAARAVWDKTDHAHAYKTLTDGFKEFNLDCVSCHVTGYDRRGGSTVTHVEGLKDVQCEVCHGAGSLHSKNPEKVAIPVPKPGAELCLSCHHPPHVHTFDAKAKMEEILGPGHGRKL